MGPLPKGADSVIVSSPWWCLLAAFALLPWFGLNTNDNRVQKVLRSLVFIALALGLARPHLIVDEKRVDRVFVIDRSDSIDESVADTVSQQLEDFTGQSPGRSRSLQISVPLSIFYHAAMFCPGVVYPAGGLR